VIGGNSKEMRDILLGKKKDKGIAGIISPIATPQLIEIVASAGLDFYIIDGEHGMIQPDICECAVLTARTMKLPLMVRIPTCETWYISQLLDMGVDAVLIPHIVTVQQAQDAVNAAMFPPYGKRGIGQCRANEYTLTMNTDDFITKTNTSTPLCFMIEDVLSTENLDGILSVHGLAGVFIGTRDLSTDLGHPGDICHKDVLTVIRKIIHKCKEYHIPVIMPVGRLEDIEMWQNEGIRNFVASLYPMLFKLFKEFNINTN